MICSVNDNRHTHKLKSFCLSTLQLALVVVANVLQLLRDRLALAVHIKRSAVAVKISQLAINEVVETNNPPYGDGSKNPASRMPADRLLQSILRVAPQPKRIYRG